MMNQLFCDGGCVGPNPSPIAGTWACRLVTDEKVICEHSGVITPLQADMVTISNNLTEMLALICGLEMLPDNWTGTVYSDSQVTLGRVSMGWKWSNIPLWMHRRFQAQTARLVNWKRIKWVLLDGHPAKAQLEAGIGKRGHPVSIHNAAVDRMCGEQAAKFLEARVAA